MVVLEPLSKGVLAFYQCIQSLNPARVSPASLISLARRTWEQLKAFDALEACLHRMRPREERRGDAERMYDAAVLEVGATRSIAGVKAALRKGLEAMESVPVQEGFMPVRVGIVGEIYVLLEPAANLGVEKVLGEMGAEVVRSMFLSGWVEHNAVHEGRGLSIKAAARPYLPEMVGGHGQDSVGHTVLYARRGVEGVVRLAPFTCGSGRQLASVLLGADVVKNEITTHAIAAMLLVPRVQTVIEIGGQDSKVTIIRDGVVVDFGMNTICAAGTGSFLDQQAGRLGIPIEQLGDIAMASRSSVRIAGRCAVFAESDMIHKQQRAFEEALGFEIVVPGYYGVMGALGVVVVAREATEGKKTRFRGFSAADMVFAPVSLECSGCPNHCEIVQINGDGRPLARWGGRCERWERLSA
jgi:hypothetical protein